MVSHILGALVIILSLALFVIGLPTQAWKNYKAKSVIGLSLPLFALNFAAYAVWLWYGVLIKNAPIIVPNIPAIIFGLVILFQFFAYRRARQ